MWYADDTQAEKVLPRIEYISSTYASTVITPLLSGSFFLKVFPTPKMTAALDVVEVPVSLPGVSSNDKRKGFLR